MAWATVYTGLLVFLFPFKVRTRARLATGLSYSIMWMLRVICNVRMEVRGLENVPKEPCIILCKHQSAWETFSLQTIFPPQTWLLKRELLWLPIFGWGLAMLKPIAIDRGDGKQAIKQLLKQGKERLFEEDLNVVIFPEGTRMPYGERGKYKIGGAMLAASTGVQVVPVAHNAGKHWGRNAFLKHPGTIVMSIGQPIDTRGKKPDEINRLVEDWIESEMTRLG